MILRISDLETDPSAYFLQEGTGNWPLQAWQPSASGIKYIVCSPGDYTQYADPNFGLGEWHVRMIDFHNEDNPLYVVYWDGVSDEIDLENIPHPVEQNDSSAVFGLIGVNGEGVYQARYIKLIGLVVNDAVIRGTNDVVCDRCEYRSQIRVRFSSQDIMIRDCLIHRQQPWIAGDVIGIQVVDGVNRNVTIEGCTILNFTDAIQTTARDDDDFHAVPGLLIRNNMCGPSVPPNADGSSVEGLEQVGGIDLKTGGTPESPVVIEGNTFFGNRPNDRTPGYIHNIHVAATDIVFRNNIHANSHCGIFIPTIRRDGVPIRPAIQFEGDVWVGIRDQGPGTTFFDENGEVLVGPHGGADYKDVKFLACSALAQHENHADPIHTRTFENCEAVYGDTETTLLPSYTDLVPKRQAILVDKVIPIRFTSMTITVQEEVSAMPNNVTIQLRLDDNVTGWPTEPLVIGDGYTTANGRAFRITLYDENDSSLTTLGNQSFSDDAEFVVAVRGTSTTILSGTVTWVATSGATPGHFLVQLPTTQTALASVLTKYTGRLILWPDTVHRATVLEQCFEFVEEID